MQSNDSSIEYVIAEGPSGLMHVLDDFLEKTQKDPAFAAAEHYILYQLGNQKSLIKVDMSQHPYQFWYYDLMGRPATRIVKETIAEFLWEKCDEREGYEEESEARE